MKSGSTPEVRDYFADLQAPSIEDMSVQLEMLVQQGVLTPEDAQAVLVEQSAMNDITTDPSLKQNQLDALASLKDISDNGGMTIADKANLSRIANEEAASAKGARFALTLS